MSDDEFHVAVIGTSLAESIAAAALAKAGLKVLHLDISAEYGGRDASLNIRDISSMLSSPPLTMQNLTAPIPPSESLLAESRQYSISLSPSIVPSVSPIIDTLIQSGVSRYVPFKLLDGVGLYSSTESGSTVQMVPSSKEDVFKNKSLSLPKKRKLMKFLMGVSAAEYDEIVQPGQGIKEFLESGMIGLDGEIIQAVVYTLAFCQDEQEDAKEVLKRLRKYIISTGKHGNSPFLVGHYGGAGELVQGFCRTCAVGGGVYILGRPFTVTKATDGSFELHVEGVDEVLKATILVSTAEHLPQEWRLNQQSPSRTIGRSIAIIDQPIKLTKEAEDGLDTAVLVFPPGSVNGGQAAQAVTCLIAGENSMSCPSGKHVLYLMTQLPSGKSAQEILTPYLNALIDLAEMDGDPLMLVFFEESILEDTETTVERIVTVRTPTYRLSEFGDSASEEGKRVFWETVRLLGLDGDGDEKVTHMWPSLEPEESSVVDDW